MSKFKVGDIVRGISDRYGVTNTNMTKARVMSVRTIRDYGDEFLSVKILKHKDKSFIGCVFEVRAKDSELVEPYQDWKVVIVPRGNKTVAKIYKNNANVKTVECKKHPDDEYSMYEAIKVVTERLREPEKPKYYNGKVVCIGNHISLPLTCGKIYQFKDGYITNDIGRLFPCYPVTSFEDFQDSTATKWLEVVE